MKKALDEINNTAIFKEAVLAGAVDGIDEHGVGYRLRSRAFSYILHADDSGRAMKFLPFVLSGAGITEKGVLFRDAVRSLDAPIDVFLEVCSQFAEQGLVPLHMSKFEYQNRLFRKFCANLGKRYLPGIIWLSENVNISGSDTLMEIIRHELNSRYHDIKGERMPYDGRFAPCAMPHGLNGVEEFMKAVVGWKFGGHSSHREDGVWNWYR